MVVLIIEIIILYLYSSQVFLYYIFAISLGISTIVFLKYGLGVPFPHDYGKLRNPDISTFTNIIYKIESGDKLDIVLGEIDLDFLDKNTTDRLMEKIKRFKNFKLRIIVGPKIHMRTKDFFKQLFNYPNKVEIYRKPTRPIRHFRLLHNKKLILEPPHEEFVYSKFWIFGNSNYLNRKYQRIFKIYIKNSNRCTNVNDISFKLPPIKLRDD